MKAPAGRRLHPPMRCRASVSRVRFMDSSTSTSPAIADFADESGVTAIEYGLLAALIVVVCIGAISATGTSLGAVYTTWTNAVLAAL